MRHPITGRRISRERYEAEQVAFAKRIAEMKAEEAREYITCRNPLTYEEILNWRGFSFEISRSQSWEEQRKNFAADIRDGLLDDGHLLLHTLGISWDGDIRN